MLLKFETILKWHFALPSPSPRLLSREFQLHLIPFVTQGCMKLRTFLAILKYIFSDKGGGFQEAPFDLSCQTCLLSPPGPEVRIPWQLFENGRQKRQVFTRPSSPVLCYPLPGKKKILSFASAKTGRARVPFLSKNEGGKVPD